MPEGKSFDDTEIERENKPAFFAASFSESFFCFQTIEDIKNMTFYYDKEDFVEGAQAFLYIMTMKNAEYQYSYDDADRILKQYLGIENYLWGEQEYFGIALWKYWDMRNHYVMLDEQTDTYVDITFYADRSYMTPAKKMRYYYAWNGEDAVLLSSELMRDYGFAPNFEMF